MLPCLVLDTFEILLRGLTFDMPLMNWRCNNTQTIFVCQTARVCCHPS